MAGPVSISPAAWGLAGVLFVAAVSVYSRVARRIATEGGKVRSEEFTVSELLMTFVFAGFFGLMMYLTIQKQAQGPHPIKIDQVLPSSVMFIVFSVGILGFLRFVRHLRPSHLFGVDQVSPLATLGWAVGLLLAAFPLASAANAITIFLLHGQAEPQPLVDLFAQMARKHDWSAVAKIVLSGVFIQPACEEFLFRGFFYGVWKRFIGPVPAGFLACLLFAAFHTSLTALAGLFILAVCLNLAYERTGSLLVPIGMHALFNLSSLLVIFLQAQLPIAS